jgi:integrase/recombinase XerD
MLTPKIIFYKHKKYSDGTHPIIIQVIKDSKPIRKVIGRCLESEWLKSKNRVGSKNIRYMAINDDIDRALANYGLNKKESFISFYGRQIELIKDRQQVSLYTLNKRVLEQIKAYNPKVDFDIIDERFITGFAAYLNKTNKVNSIRIKMQNFGKILKEAFKENLISKNPMQYLTFKKEKTMKSKLNLEELKMIMGIKLDGKMQEVRDLFIASIFMRGIRIGDALSLKPENIKADRVTYIENKTGKLVNIAIVPELQEIFNRWVGSNPFGYIFSFLKVPEKLQKDKFFMKAAITRAIARINYNLGKIAKAAGIDKIISSHTARHSFSLLARNTIQDTTITKDLVGHSSLAIHENYISEISDNTVLDIYAKQILDKLK